MRSPDLNPAEAAEPWWIAWAGQEVVLDVEAPFVYIGRFERLEHGYAVLTGADSHDLRDTQTTRERYILDARLHGIHANRRTIHVDLRQVVGVSRLADVIA